MHNIKTSFVSLAVNRRMVADQSLILWQPVADWFSNFNDDSKFSRRPIAEWLAIGRRLVCNWSATDCRSKIWSVIGCRWLPVVFGRRLVVAIVWPSLYCINNLLQSYILHSDKFIKPTGLPEAPSAVKVTLIQDEDKTNSATPQFCKFLFYSGS